MDFDNLKSVSSVSDTLSYEAVSIAGRDCFWDGSLPNPLKMSVGSPTMSVSSNIPEPSGAGARVGDLADPVPSRPKVGGITVISYHDHFVPAISYHSENHFRTITISYHMQIDTLLPFRTICRSTHYDHFVPYADRYII